MVEQGAADPRFFSQSFRDIADSDFARLDKFVEPLDLNGKTLLITGATGFFGAWLLALLAWLVETRKFSLKVFAVSRRPENFLARHDWASDTQWLNWIKGDVREFSLPDGPLDCVIHAATDTSASAGDRPDVMLSTIIDGTVNVLKCAERCGAGRVLLVSSGGVYGAQPVDMKEIGESAMIAPSTMEPKSAYGEGKRVMELLGAIQAKRSAVQVVLARCFTFVGPGLPLDGHFAIGNFIRDALTKDRIVVSGDGRAVRSYLYVADLAVWLFHLLLRGESCQVYNVGSDRAVNMRELANLVGEVLVPNKEVIIQGNTGQSPVGNRYVPSIVTARNALGLDVWTELPMAIQQTAKWARGHV